MARIIIALLAVGLSLVSSPASAYVWRCNTPNGYVWTEQPPQYGDCEEYDGTFNRRAAPPSAQYMQPQYAAPQVQYAPPPPPGYGYSYTYASPYPYPAPYPYPYYPSYSGYYGGPGLYLGFPGLFFDFRFGGGHFGHFGHGRHFGGHFGGHRFGRH
jgi:hypothetical protein